MKIKEKTREAGTKVKNLKGGDLFRLHGSSVIFMKLLAPVHNRDIVALEDGSTIGIEQDALVKIVNGTFVEE